MTKQSSDVPRRAGTKTPSVPTPNIALELERTIVCCQVVSDALSEYPGLSLQSLLSAVSDELGIRTVGSNIDLVTQTLSSRAFAHVASTIRLLEADVAEITGLFPSFQDERSQLAALQSVGVDVRDLKAASLRPYATNPVVVLVEKIRGVIRLKDWIADGELVSAVSFTYNNTTQQADLDGTIGLYTNKGVDGQGVCWSLITFETNRHINLVWHFANRLTRSFPDRAAADLFGWGWQGLRVALRNFDPERGFLFSTYAATRISGSIRDGVRSESPIPKRLTTYWRKVAKAEEDLTQELGRVPNLIEVATHLGEDLEQLRIIPRLAPAASIDEITDLTRDAAPHWLVDGDDPAEKAVNTVRAEEINEAIGTLPAEEATAVRLLVMEGLNPQEAREITGATARQMRIRKDRGLASLKTQLEERGWAGPVFAS